MDSLKVETRTLSIEPEESTTYPAARSPIVGVLKGVHWYGPLPRDVPRDMDETVKALVDCFVLTILLAVTTVTLIGVAEASAGVRVMLALTGK